MYPIYNLLDPEDKVKAREIAERYPFSTESVSEMIAMTGSAQNAEEYIKMRLIYWRAGDDQILQCYKQERRKGLIQSVKV